MSSPHLRGPSLSPLAALFVLAVACGERAPTPVAPATSETVLALLDTSAIDVGGPVEQFSVLDSAPIPSWTTHCANGMEATARGDALFAWRVQPILDERRYLLQPALLDAASDRCPGSDDFSSDITSASVAGDERWLPAAGADDLPGCSVRYAFFLVDDPTTHEPFLRGLFTGDADQTVSPDRACQPMQGWSLTPALTAHDSIGRLDQSSEPIALDVPASASLRTAVIGQDAVVGWMTAHPTIAGAHAVALHVIGPSADFAEKTIDEITFDLTRIDGFDDALADSARPYDLLRHQGAVWIAWEAKISGVVHLRAARIDLASHALVGIVEIADLPANEAYEVHLFTAADDELGLAIGSTSTQRLFLIDAEGRAAERSEILRDLAGPFVTAHRASGGWIVVTDASRGFDVRYPGTTGDASLHVALGRSRTARFTTDGHLVVGDVLEADTNLVVLRELALTTKLGATEAAPSAM